MTSSYIFVQGDTEPSLNAVLHREDEPENVLDLTGVLEIRFQMRKADDRRFTVDNVASIVDPDDGTVRYLWGPNDLAVPGEYEVQWRVTYADARKQTTAQTQTITVRRR